MRLPTVLTGSVVAVAMVFALGTKSLSAQSDGVKPAAPEPAPAVQNFSILKGVKVVPLASSELKTIKGLHVHFLNGSNNVVETPFGPIQGIHLAGDVKTENNWSNAWGGSDGVAVAPSYKGLCTASSLSGPGSGNISIPQAYAQCPLP